MPRQLTLQTTIAIAILVIGVLGISLVFITDITYRQLAYQQQRDSLTQLLAFKSNDLIKTLSERQKQLGLRLQSDTGFNSAYKSRDQSKLPYWLDQEFSRYFVTIGLIKLEKIIVFDSDFQVVAMSERGSKIDKPESTPCYHQVAIYQKFNAIERLKPHSSLCQHNNRGYLSTIVSIGTIRTSGYIQILGNPAHILTRIQTELGLPITIFTNSGELLHESANWPDSNTLREKFLVSDYIVTDNRLNPLLKIHAASDITDFKNQLSSTETSIIIAALLITLLTVLIALILLHRGLNPLKKLQKAAESSEKGRFVSVDTSSLYSEISTPILAFNSMVKTIQSLIHDLMSEVERHKVTEKNLKTEKNKAESLARDAHQQRKFLQMTLQSIVDGVITTDISGYIKTMNPMAEQLTGWNEKDARNKPLIQVMHALSEETLKRIYDPTENIEHKSVLDEPVNAILIQQHSNIETPIEYITAPMRDNNGEIAGIVIIIHDESVQRSLNRQLTFQATHDALTGLINRYEFERRLKAVISSRDKESSLNTLCYIDLDQFKLVNDTCGHTAGDELLKKITLLLQDHIKQKGTLARLGGDEFGLLLENCDIEHAQVIAAELLGLIKDFHFSWNGNNFTIGASIGIAAITRHTESCEEILSNADSACYLAKDSGRNRIQVFTAEDDKLLTQQREMHWVSRINLAMEENRFQLYFQEIVPLNNQEKSFIMHGEILLRMIDKEGDIVSPSHFLPAAERYNMISLVDSWVVEKSIRWLAERKEKVLISVNLSGVSLSNREFLNFVVSKIKQYNINPELLCFEITETAAISHMNIAIHFMTVLKKLGCSFALDDFGSGLSSFSYLTSLPVDYLKIDGAFVMDIDKDPMHYAMVKSINEVGQVMGIKTIAEYAASESIINCLQEVGVDNAQGYAIARPIPLDSLNPSVQKPSLSIVNSK